MHLLLQVFTEELAGKHGRAALFHAAQFHA